MGWTRQAIGPTKRQYNNENSSNLNTSEPECEDDSMRTFNKRSRDTSPPRRPLGCVDMLTENQHITKKTEALNINEEYRKENAVNLGTPREDVVDSVYSGNPSPATVSSKAVRGIRSNVVDSPELMEDNGVISEKGDRSASVVPAVPHRLSMRRPTPLIKPLTFTIPIGVRKSFAATRKSRSRSHKARFNDQIKNGGSGDARGQHEEEEDSSSSVGEDEETDEIITTTSESDEKEVESSAETDTSESIVCQSLPLSGRILSGVRPSQFPYVPPYINFCQHNEKCECLPPEIKKLMKWRLSTITPTVVKKTVISSGFRTLKKTVEWTGQWGKHLKAVMFRTSLKDYQKLNHLPATFQVGRKDKLWRNYQRYNSKFGQAEFGFLPKSYILPQEMKSFKMAWDSSVRGRPWIIKPPAGARGDGIRVINKWGQVPKKRPTIAQKYIVKPFLINSRKFDIRLYVLVTSFHPLRIYIYRDGLVRFAPVKYSQDAKRVSDRFMHLTNYSINKHCDLYTKNEDADSMEGHKWTLKSLWRYLKKDGHNVDKLWKSIADIAIKTLICAEDPITASAFNLASRYNGYELFGLDVILDEKLKPWLLEVNISPSLHSSSPLDLAVKGPLIREVFNIAGYHFPDLMSSSLKKKFVSGMNPNVKLETPVFDKRLYASILSTDEKMKQHLIKKNFLRREKYLSAVLDSLTPDDLRYLIQSEDELSQCDGFKRIFPSTNSYEYFQFFEAPRYYNQLLDAWEHMYAGCRQNGIKRLQEMCNLKVHLNVAQNTPGKNTISADGKPSCTMQKQDSLCEEHLNLKLEHDSTTSDPDPNGNSTSIMQHSS